MTGIKDLIEDTEITLMQEYKDIVAKGYAIDQGSIELRVYSKHVTTLANIKDRYFKTDTGAIIRQDNDPQSEYQGQWMLLAMKKF